MYAYGYIKANPMQATDVYTEQCSVSVNAKDLATMAGTLANAGKNPVTGKQVMKADYVPKVLAVMATAGLYDDSGKWLFRTGSPRQERRRRRPDRRLPGQVRDRGRLAAARRGRQLRPRAEGDRGRVERARRQPAGVEAAVGEASVLMAIEAVMDTGSSCSWSIDVVGARLACPPRRPASVKDTTAWSQGARPRHLTKETSK